MRRLVYSPKAYVYIQTDSGTYNISDLVVSGSVHRKVNQVSTAEVTFQNPNRTFTQPGNPTFRPMDKITIFLQRLPGFPVQSFTGYLDQTPYYQMYPGTCTLRASCTLKRLQYTYFDPGLPFVINFLARYGWLTDGNGTIQNPKKPGTKPVDEAQAAQSASMADLMFASLKHIAGWDPDLIFIEQLPTSLTDRIHEIYFALHESADAASEDFKQWLKDYIGAGSVGGGGTAPSGTPSGPVKELKNIVPIVVDAAEKNGIPAELPLAVIGLETGYGVNMHNPRSDANGWFQWTRGSFGPSENAGCPGSWAKCGHPATLKYSDNDDLGIASNGFAYAAKLAANKNPSFRRNLQEWAMYIQGVTLSNNPLYGTFNAEVEKAKGYISSYGGTSAKAKASSVEDQQKGGKEGVDTQTKSGDPAATSDPSQTKSVTIYAPIKGNVHYGRGWHQATEGGPIEQTSTSGHIHWHSGIDAGVPAGTPCIAPCDGEITLSTPTWSDGGMIHFKFTEQTGDINAGTIIGWGHVQATGLHPVGKVKGGTQIALSGNPGGGPHVHFIQRNDGTDGTGDGNTDPLSLLKALQKGETAPTDASDPGSGGPDSTGFGDALAAAKTASVFTTLNFPQAVSAAESLVLRGDDARGRSLMNDQPLLPFIEQLAKGSLRSFMTLPNGDFFSFHPDYFGAFNTAPYWEIDDIEVLEGNIDLTDEALITHVFVTGATLPSQQIDITRKLNTHGVVNVLNAGTADFLNTDPKEAKKTNEQGDTKEKDLTPFLGSIDASIAFLTRYGTRPYVEDAPFIRSHIFETFYAYQTFMLAWARQFMTTFSFTFMPEIYPGGLVKFKDHDIQMYVDEVHHSWDYSSGFTTQANLSAPSSTGTNKSISRGMVRAMSQKGLGDQ
jgi:murein DD-endopeptidase MepM/ murein hydrolase activator NlpD